VTVVVTGATGHIGANLVRALLQKGEQVRAIVREDTRALEGLAVERVRADVLDRESLVRAFTDARVVYHLAGRVSILEEAERLQEVNVEGTRNVVEACLECGVQRLVYACSIEALLRPAKPDPIDESIEPGCGEPTTVYGRTKAQGEQVVRAGIARGLDAVIVYPTAVVGPFDFKPSFFGQFFLDFGRMRTPALVPGGFDLVDVRDVVAGLLGAADRGRKGQGYLLSGGYLSVGEIAKTAQECTGVPRPRIVVPYWLAAPAAVLAPLYYRLVGLCPRFTRMAVKMLQDGRRVSCEKARRELGYSPRDPREGIRAAVAWFRESGRLPRRLTYFRSRKSPGLIAAVAAILLVCITGGAFLVATGSGRDIGLGVAALVASLAYLWLTVPVHYQVTDEELRVRGGPFYWKIPLGSILQVRPSRNPLSAPAWSLARLQVSYKKKNRKSFVLISPSDREAFLETLQEAADGLEARGDALVQTSLDAGKSTGI
jgi:dihydroflavonol-4-reductase